MCPLIIHSFITLGKENNEEWQRRWCHHNTGCEECKRIIQEQGWRL
jgi:hypothetical protein